jgi:hypothetical protein
MMWMHHADRVLRSPDGEGSGGGGGAPTVPPQGDPAGQPQGQPPSQPPANDLISRDEARKAFEARDQAKRERDEAKAERDRLAARVAELERVNKPPDPKPTPVPAAAADPNAEVLARLDKIERERQAEVREARQRTLVDAVSRHVPERHRGMVPLLVQGMHPNGLPDGETEAVANTIVAALKHQHASLFTPEPGSHRTALQTGPDGKVDYSTVRSHRELSPEQIREMPVEKVLQLANGQAGPNGDGLLLGSGRRRR